MLEWDVVIYHGVLNREHASYLASHRQGTALIWKSGIVELHPKGKS